MSKGLYPRTTRCVIVVHLEAPEQIGRVERRGALLEKDDVESHQGHARLRQRIDGHDSQRMLERRQ